MPALRSLELCACDDSTLECPALEELIFKGIGWDDQAAALFERLIADSHGLGTRRACPADTSSESLAAHLRKLQLDADLASRLCENMPQAFLSLESLALVSTLSSKEIAPILACTPALREVDLNVKDCRGIHQLWSVAGAPSAGVVCIHEGYSVPVTPLAASGNLVAVTLPHSR